MPMVSPRSQYLPVAGHEIHLTAWGDPAAPALMLWHGLARTGRDFDTLARHFADRFHVLCPDTIGRGLSSWSSAPETDYTLPAYCRHAVELLDRLGIAQCRWVGTSMGGLIGMALAGTPETASRIERLVLNDVAPRLNQAAIERILAYVAIVPEFATMAEFEGFLRTVYAPFGQLTDAEWRLHGRDLHAPARQWPNLVALRPGGDAGIRRAVPGVRHVGNLRRHYLPGPGPARRALGPGRGPGGGGNDPTRPQTPAGQSFQDAVTPRR